MTKAKKENSEIQKNSEAILIKSQIQLIEKMLKERRDRFEKILNDNADKFFTFFLNYVYKNPKLLYCEPSQLIALLIEISKLNLMIGYNLVDIVPFYDNTKKKYLPTIIIGYQGYVELLYRSGHIKVVYAKIVKEKDKFEISYGTDGKLIHIPNFSEDNKEIIGAYAYAETIEGGRVYDFIPLSEIQRIRQRSKMADGFAWVNDFEAMSKKTALRQLVKYLPKYVYQDKIINAIKIDEAQEWDKIKYENEEVIIDYEDTKETKNNINEIKEKAKKFINEKSSNSELKVENKESTPEAQTSKNENSGPRNSDLIELLFNENNQNQVKQNKETQK
jgi:recombination protein RecT